MPYIVLSYFMLGPPLAGTSLYAIMALGQLSLADWASALLPMIGIAFIIGAVPAILTAIVAAVLARSKTFILRLLLPAVVAATTGAAAAWLFVLRLGFDAAFLLTTALAAAIGALVPGLLVELARMAYRRQATTLSN